MYYVTATDLEGTLYSSTALVVGQEAPKESESKKPDKKAAWEALHQSI
jgi:hypothetical protein